MAVGIFTKDAMLLHLPLSTRGSFTRDIRHNSVGTPSICTLVANNEACRSARLVLLWIGWLPFLAF